MGVPKFYKWLSERYPLINQRIEGNIELLPEFDNMYLDANGIIHNCSHPHDQEISERLSMEDMVLGMMAYINKMVHIIRPRKVLFVAIDGCAPRAKMNQQRTRRFAAARDTEQQRREAVEKGELREADIAGMFDSNVITPGTAFMAELSTHFEFFLRKKLKEDSEWAHLEVIYSGHNVPGEGEHKIMDYIRHTRMQPGYDPNTRHCLCGLDADLIMLGLASHEPHFSLLREEVDFTRSNFGNKNATKQVKKQIERDKWQLLHLSALREYLQLEFSSTSLPFGFDLERIIDDWVFMVMLVGNDFLPHLPSLDIAEGALDLLSALYKELLPKLGGYLVEANEAHWDRVEDLLDRLGAMEEQMLAERDAQQERRVRRDRRGGHEPAPIPAAVVAESEDELDLDEDLDPGAAGANDDDPSSVSPPIPLFSSRKLLYYESKFGVPNATRTDPVVSHVVLKYKEGLDWCLRYYYQGVPSWTWFYPFHYAPMASDLCNLSSLTSQMDLGEPFPPFMQLLSCLPSASAHCLPRVYAELMTSASSPIAAFYPTQWPVDENGKTSPWQFVNLLPFIDERLLREAVALHCPDSVLTPEERARNTFGEPKLFRRDVSNQARLESTLKALKGEEHCETSVIVYALPPMARHSPTLLSGVCALPGDPQLRAATFFQGARLERVDLNIFGRPSHKETLCIEFKQHEPALAEAKTFKAALKGRSTLWVNYPYLREGLVLAVADEEERIDAQTGASRRHTPNERMTFLKDAASAKAAAQAGSRTVGTGGMLMLGDECCVLVLIKPLVAMIEDKASGLRHRSFKSDDETWVPAALCVLDNLLPDPRFADSPAVPLAERFPVGCSVLCAQSTGYGMLGIVEGHSRESQVLVSFPSKQAKQTEFGHVIAGTMKEAYVSLSRAAQALGLAPAVLDKALSSILVPVGNRETWDLGLNLRVGGDMVVPGYCRCDKPDSAAPVWATDKSMGRVAGFAPVHASQHSGHQQPVHVDADKFSYTPQALELVVKYREKFPRLFERVAMRPNEREYRVSDLGSPKELEMVRLWLQQVPTFKASLVPGSSRFMTREAVLAVEAAAGLQHAKEETLEATRHQIELAPALLLRPPVLVKGLIESPSASTPPRLGDRVANMGSPHVPFGLRGTVIATHASTGNVEVVFDAFFVDGTTLHGLCSRGKGYFLPWTQLLNLSTKAPVQVGKPEALLPILTPSVPPIKPVVAKFVPAQPPPPPQQLPKMITPLTTTPPQLVAAAAPALAASQDKTDDLADYWKQLMSKKKQPAPLLVTTPATAPPLQAATTPLLASTAIKALPVPLLSNSGQASPVVVATPAAPPLPVVASPPPKPVAARPTLDVLDDLVRRAHITEGRAPPSS